VYGLVPNKTEEAYKVILKAVKDAANQHGIPNVAPETIMYDFELAILNAAAETFPTSTIRCCFFHLGQSVYRKVQSEGLQAQYNDRTLKEAVHMMLSLAFVPEEEVAQNFDLLYDEIPDDLVGVATYFEENYVSGRRGRGRRRAVPARYHLSKWNCYEAAIQNKHRTNNISEGWHNKFQLVVGKHHPSLYGCLTEINKEQDDTDTILRSMDLGQKVKAAPKKNNGGSLKTESDGWSERTRITRHKTTSLDIYEPWVTISSSDAEGERL